MKTIKTLVIVAGLSGLLASCYEDKGNYDYSGINKVTIDQGSSRLYTISMGQTLTIAPTILCSGGEEARKHLSYLWELNGDEISTEPVLNWICDRRLEGTSENLLLTVTDNSTGVVYRTTYSVSFAEKYEGTGVFVLAKDRKTGDMCVHMVKRELYENENEETIETYEPHQNIFQGANPGMKLPQGSRKMYVRFANEMISNGYYEVHHQLSFLEDNALTSVTPGTFLKEESTLEGMFAGGLPSDLQDGVEDLYFGHYIDLMFDKKGHVYTRMKTTDEFFEFDKFLSEPLAYFNPQTNEYEVLEGVQLISTGLMGLKTENCLLYDTCKKRLFVIWDYYYEPIFGGEGYLIGKLDLITSKMSSDWDEAAPSIEEAFSGKYDILHFAAYREEHSGSDGYYFAVLKDRENGKVYHYEFGLEKEWGKANLSLKLVKYVEMDAETATLFENPDNVICTLKLGDITWTQAAHLTLIGSGNDIYVYNRDVKNNALRLLSHFDAPVAKMVCMDSALWPTWMGVAFKDGSFEIISLENAMYTTWDGHVWKSENLDLGEPVDLYFEAGYSLQW